MDLRIVFDQIQRLFAGRVSKSHHEDGPSSPWLSVHELARMEEVAFELLHLRPRRARGNSGPTGCDQNVVGVPYPFACGRFPFAVHPFQSVDCFAKVRLKCEVLLVELEVFDHLVSSRIARSSSWALPVRATPISPWGCANAAGHSVAATTPPRPPGLPRSQSPCPAYGARPQRPDRPPTPPLPRFRYFHP